MSDGQIEFAELVAAGVFGFLVCVSLTLALFRVWIGPLVCTALFVSASLVSLIFISGSGTTRGYGASVGGPPISVDRTAMTYWAGCGLAQLATVAVAFRPQRRPLLGQTDEASN